MFKSRHTLLYTAVLTALCGCSMSGGSFDDVVGSASVAQNSSGAPSSAPAFVDANAPEAGDLTETGYSVTVLCGQECFARESVLEADTVLARVYDEQRARARTGGDYDTVEFLADFVHNKPAASNESINVINGNSTGGKWEGAYTDNGIDIGYYKDSSSPSYSSVLIKNFKDTRVGVLYLYDSVSDKMHWNIFYNGKNKTYDMPVSGTATYTGNWAYATKNFKPDGSYEVNSGRQFENYKLAENTATFTADFSAKKLTGDLKAEMGQMSSVGNLGKIHYQVDANMSHNGFTGTATVGDENTLHNGLGSQTITLGNATVSGSFYGDAAAELAGRLNENSGQLVGVFAASRNGSGTDIKTDGKLYQADYLPFDSNASNTNKVSEKDTFTATNFSGNVKKLQIDGVVIDLGADACCDDYKALRFGGYKTPDDKSGYFTQGFLTPESQMPTTGSAKYHGQWSYYGFGSTKDAQNQDVYASAVAKQAAAEFDADFANKTLTGKLHSPNGAIGGTPAVSFEATISGNGFSADNVTDFSVLTDYGANTGSVPTIKGPAKVEGNFYGENASEIGGKIWKEDKSFAGVFGGRQIQTP